MDAIYRWNRQNNEYFSTRYTRRFDRRVRVRFNQITDKLQRIQRRIPDSMDELNFTLPEKSKHTGALWILSCTRRFFFLVCTISPIARISFPFVP